MGTFLEIAMPLIQRGIPVIPVQPNEKRCLLPEWQMKATTDIEQVKLWQTENPNFNIGCVGKPDGFVMLDCDVVGLREQIEKETKQRFPRTLIVKSAGKGAEHLYFRQTDESRRIGNRKSANLFDLQSVDRYVVGAGSTLSNGKRYEIVDESPIADFPAWLAAWIDRYSDIVKEHGGKGAPVHEDFDFEAFCDHFNLDGWDEDDKFILKACPFKGDRHTSNGKPDYKASCIFFDGSTIGFSCFATSCEGHGKTIGDLVSFLTKVFGRYDGVIFKTENAEELIESFGAEEEVETCDQFGCNCSKRHAFREEIEAIIKEDDERKAQTSDAKTIRISETPQEAESGELVLASGQTEGGKFMALGGVLASDVATEELKWLWDQRIPSGKTTLFTGKADNGKSMCLLDVIARTTTGKNWPDGTANTLGARRVLLAASEDDPADTLVPRLMAAGADLTKVVLVTITTQAKGAPKSKRMLKLKEDAKLLEAALKQNPDIALVALDPLSSFFGGESLNKDETVRPVMDALSNTLRKTGATLIGIVHTNKRSDVDAMEKVLGASSLTGSARVVYGFSRDPENEGEFFMALIKNNLSKKRGGMKYKIAETKVTLTKGTAFAPHADWIGQHESSANDLLDKERELRKGGGMSGVLAEASKLELAKKFILENVRRGDNIQFKLINLAAEDGISRATMFRAAKDLNLKSSDNKPKRWHLPYDGKPECTIPDDEVL